MHKFRSFSKQYACVGYCVFVSFQFYTFSCPHCCKFIKKILHFIYFSIYCIIQRNGRNVSFLTSKYFRFNLKFIHSNARHLNLFCICVSSLYFNINILQYLRLVCVRCYCNFVYIRTVSLRKIVNFLYFNSIIMLF